MKLHKHWVRVRGEAPSERGHPLSAVGWSSESEAEARAMAEARLAKLQAIFAQGFPARNGYEYGERPLAEPVTSEVRDESGDVLAHVTRNAYGALVLNTERVVFIDVDFDSVPEPMQGFLAGLFGQKPTPEQRALAHVEAVAREMPNWVLRVYRTFAGLRLALLNQDFEDFDEGHLRVLERFGSDPLYVAMCRAQRCFRARLTPKPWRMGLVRPPARFPFATTEEATRMSHWVEDYDRARLGYATCRPLSTLGLGHPSPLVSRVLAAHDNVAVRDGVPLA